METRCDNCNNIFKVKYLHKKYSKGIEEHYFKCPHCKFRYSFYWTNPEIRKLDNKRKKLLKGKYPVEVDKITGIQKEINELSETLREKMIARLNLNDYKTLKKGDDIYEL